MALDMVIFLLFQRYFPVDFGESSPSPEKNLRINKSEAICSLNLKKFGWLTNGNPNFDQNYFAAKLFDKSTQKKGNIKGRQEIGSK